MSDALYDVVRVNDETGIVSVIATGKTEKDAEAVFKLAVFRQGCDEAFFAEVPAGIYREGDTWRGQA
jgi:hypothetical protein